MKLTDKELQMAKEAGLHVANKDAYSKATFDDLSALNESPLDGYSYNNITDELAKFAELIRADSVPEWLPISLADKNEEVWILGIDIHNEQRVIRWCTEYPLTNGAWMYAYDYIVGIQTFNPIAWQPLQTPPKLKDKP
jgi:hypothetical protein